jgi:hypothetical protein
MKHYLVISKKNVVILHLKKNIILRFKYYWFTRFNLLANIVLFKKKIQILFLYAFIFISEYTKMYISITIIPNIMY